MDESTKQFGRWEKVRTAIEVCVTSHKRLALQINKLQRMREKEVKAISDYALCLRLEEVHTTELAGIEKEMRWLVAGLDDILNEVASPTMTNVIRQKIAEMVLQRSDQVELPASLWRHMES